MLRTSTIIRRGMHLALLLGCFQLAEVEGWGCDCNGCKCEGMVEKEHLKTQEKPACPKSCGGEHTCDYYKPFGYQCADMEFWGCDCSGCTCADTPTPVTITKLSQKRKLTASPQPSPDAGGDRAGGQGDPHFFGAHSGQTDFRGLHLVTFCMLTFPNISFGLTTSNAHFMLPRQEVHGSFFTHAYFVMRALMSGATILVFSNAQKLSFTVSVDNSPQLTLGPHRSVVLEDIKVQTKEVKLVVTTGDWEVTLIRRKVRVPLDEVQFRFYVSMRPLRAEKDFVVWPHGILGQTFDGDSIAVDGKMDVYNNAGSEFTTSAMAEGFIEGTATDYVLLDPFSPEFKYSRFDLRKSTPPRNVSKLTGTFRSVQNFGAGAESIEVEDA